MGSLRWRPDSRCIRQVRQNTWRSICAPGCNFTTTLKTGNAIHIYRRGKNRGRSLSELGMAKQTTQHALHTERRHTAELYIVHNTETSRWPHTRATQKGGARSISSPRALHVLHVHAKRCRYEHYIRIFKLISCLVQSSGIKHAPTLDNKTLEKGRTPMDTSRAIQEETAKLGNPTDNPEVEGIVITAQNSNQRGEREREQIKVEEALECREVRINLLRGGKVPPVVCFEGPNLEFSKAQFYIDTGAEISVIKEGCINKESTQVDANEILMIKGVVKGESYTKGKAQMEINGLKCTMHLVEVPLDLVDKYLLENAQSDKLRKFKI